MLSRVESPGKRRRVVACIVALLPLAATAEQPPEERPERALQLAEDGGDFNLLVPVLEVPALNIAHWAVLKVWGKPYADISLRTMGANLDGPWRWDDDAYLVNGLGHPYQGSMAFNAARSSGLGFWASAPFVLVSSGMWELLMENKPPSKNDLLATTLGGLVLGEMLHRLSLLVLDAGAPSVARSVAAFLVDPVGNFNYLLFGRKKADFFAHETVFARGLAGLTSYVLDYTRLGGVQTDNRGGPQMLVGFEVIGGLPGDVPNPQQEPFGHYLAWGRFSGLNEPQMALSLSGLLYGGHFEAGPARGLGGLYVGYDFANITALRVTTVSTGIGAAAQIRVGGGLVLLPSLIVSGVPYAAGGILPPVGSRDYLRGPGFQGRAGLRLVQPGWIRLGLDASVYRFNGAYTGEGVQTTWYGNASLEVVLGRFGAFGFEATLADGTTDRAGLPLDLEQRSVSISLVWSVFNDPALGAFVPK